MTELAKNYNPHATEKDLYEEWERRGYFQPQDHGKGERFSVLMPPPNVTGVLHLGHALENTILDIMTRYKRMQGYETLFVPGADHAAVATQARVEKNLIGSGAYTNPREELGREKLLALIRDFAEQSKSTITAQVRAMGSSCDWSRFAYTLDDTRAHAVTTVFEKMYRDGLIYRGYRVVNWSVKGQSTCSDDELEHHERTGTLYTFKYSKDFPFAIATTRPETKLGDTAVAVNPTDERYAQYIGKTFTVDVGAAKPLSLTIIADQNIDPAFGTGAVGVTPAHSMVDFEMYEKNPDIGIVPVIGKDGRMLPAAGAAYAGLTVAEARAKFVDYLRDNDLLISEEDVQQNVGTSDRFGDVVEVLPMEQWFVAVNKPIPGRDNKTLKDLMRDAVHDGVDGATTTITPARFTKVYDHWIDNLRDWCISRQVWWGHRIPVWYRGDEMVVSATRPDGDGWEQDPDTLDTWFSSGMWAFSALGWPDDLEDFRKYFPNTWMQMGTEIIFFWMARMILMATYVHGTVPFTDVYIHGILRDRDGRKFSKSLGNGIDPLDIIKDYGTDALRMALISDITPGNDARFSMDKVTDARNFTNKLWNIARYILSGTGNTAPAPIARTSADHWILARLDATITTVTDHLEHYRFAQAATALRDFTWNDFADWYVEVHKIEKNDALIRFVFRTLLALWHPFMPFVTETLFAHFRTDGHAAMLIIAPWPQPRAAQGAGDAETFVTVKNLITTLRNIRALYRLTPEQKPVLACDADLYPLATEHSDIIRRLARVERIMPEAEAATAGSAAVTTPRGSGALLLGSIIDVAAERARLEEELATARKLAADKQARLENENFTARAPQDVVAKERTLLAEAQRRAEELHNALNTLHA